MNERAQPRGGMWRRGALGLAGALAMAAWSGSSLAQVVTLTTPTTLRPTDTVIGTPPVPVATAQIVVQGTTLTIDGAELCTIASLSLVSGGMVTHTQGVGMNLRVTGNVGVGSGCVIQADSKGFRGSQGTGRGESADGRNGGGGGYGGAGRDAGGSAQTTLNSGLGGRCYGFAAIGTDSNQMFEPVQLGSGGGSAWWAGTANIASGGFGGGAIRLTIDGSLTLNGEISARGGAGSRAANTGDAPNGGGGSGGSVYVSCGSLAGSGTVVVNGGAGGTACCQGEGGGGGGGRIAIVCPGTLAEEVNITMSALGGLGNGRAGAGTIYTKFQSQSRGAIVVDAQTAGVSEPTEFFNEFSTGTLMLNANLVVQNGAWVGPAHKQANFDLVVLGDATVGTGSYISANGRGRFGSEGVGAGGSTDGRNGGGAGYGGAGCNGQGSSPTYLNSSLGGKCYGFGPLAGGSNQMFQPAEMGSGGGNSWWAGVPNINTGGFGGGVIRLSVNGMLTVNGEISASGQAGGRSANTGDAPNGGGGSGGSVNITCGTLAGNGLLAATGGNGGTACCQGEAGGGGGGRVSVVCPGNGSLGSVRTDVRGGTGNGRAGVGTVYTRMGGVARGDLIIDGLTSPVSETTELFDPSATDPLALDANVHIRNGAWVGPAHRFDGFDLVVMGDMTIGSGGYLSANARGWFGSQGHTVELLGRGDSVSGANGGGGGYGGAGGRGRVSPLVAGGAVHGNAMSPTLDPPPMGSGGGNAWWAGAPSPESGGYGGGAIRLTVAGTLSILDNGEISARGGDGSRAANTGDAPNGGGGSGGSIYVQCGTLTGAGKIYATGGSGGTACCQGVGGAGGGGRVVVLSCTPPPPLFASNQVVVTPGVNGDPGQPGSKVVASSPYIGFAPVAASVCQAAPNAAFSVTALGLGAKSYQWEYTDLAMNGPWRPVVNGPTSDGLTIAGAGTSSIMVTPVSKFFPSHNRLFRVVVTNACGTSTSAPAALAVCVANTDCQGGVSVQDLFDFLTYWFAADSRADVNGQGGVTVQDLFDFLNAYFAGC